VTETLKQETEGFPDLEAAYEAVKGVLFGPLDAATVKLKFNEIVKDAKDKRELEQGPLGILATHREDRETRDRRDYQTLTLTALLASNAAYRAAHEKWLGDVRGDGKRVDDAIEKLKAFRDVNRKVMDEYLQTTARLGDGRYVMGDGKGRYWDENMNPVTAEDAAEAVGEIQSVAPYKPRFELERRIDERLDKAEEGRAFIGGVENEFSNEDPPIAEDRMEDAAKETDQKADDVEDLVAEIESEFSKIESPSGSVELEAVPSHSHGRPMPR